MDVVGIDVDLVEQLLLQTGNCAGAVGELSIENVAQVEGNHVLEAHFPLGVEVNKLSIHRQSGIAGTEGNHTLAVLLNIFCNG